MTWLEKTAHIALIGLSVVAISLLVEQRLRESSRPISRTDAERSLTGAILHLPDVDWGKSDVTYVLQISTTCHFCAESEPFYKTLVSTNQSVSSPAALVVATADDVDVMKAYLSNAHLFVDAVVHLSQGQTPMAATPVIYEVDKGGVVKRAFIGKLDQDGEHEVLAALGR